MGTATAVYKLWIILLVPIEAAIISAQIKREEDHLERKFGGEYFRYKAEVRRWIKARSNSPGTRVRWNNLRQCEESRWS